VVKTGTKVKIIPVADVEYLQADDDYVSVFTKEGSYLKNKTMNFFEQTLDARQFVRVHRLYSKPYSKLPVLTLTKKTAIWPS
jgi:two-component system LytT family response regulator